MEKELIILDDSDEGEENKEEHDIRNMNQKAQNKN